MTVESLVIEETVNRIVSFKCHSGLFYIILPDVNHLFIPFPLLPFKYFYLGFYLLQRPLSILKSCSKFLLHCRPCFHRRQWVFPFSSVLVPCWRTANYHTKVKTRVTDGYHPRVIHNRLSDYLVIYFLLMEVTFWMYMVLITF